MIIALKKRKENIVEYLLYMWYIEDMIRANGFDIDAIRRTLISDYDRPEETRDEIARWYGELIDMMRMEGVMDSGHIQLNKNIMAELEELHLLLIRKPGEDIYHSAYYKTLPLIVQLRSKAGEAAVSEIETCFTALYGYSMLKIKAEQVSEATAEGVRQITLFLSILAARYKDDKAGNLFLN
jgi:uncharacterized protein YycO